MGKTIELAGMVSRKMSRHKKNDEEGALPIMFDPNSGVIFMSLSSDSIGRIEKASKSIMVSFPSFSCLILYNDERNISINRFED
jgi:hypothetical protein